MPDAVDVASYQRTIGPDVQVKLGIVKVSEGLSAANAYAPQQLGALGRAGARLGAYHFARGGDGAAEARAFLSAVAASGVQVSVAALDLEPFPGVGWPLNAAQTVRFTADWCDVVAAAGLEAWWYSYPDFISRLLPRDWSIDRYGCWIADPSQPANPRTGGRVPVLVQTGIGPVAGIVGGVDLDTFGPAYTHTQPSTPTSSDGDVMELVAFKALDGSYAAMAVAAGPVFAEGPWDQPRGVDNLPQGYLDYAAGHKNVKGVDPLDPVVLSSGAWDAFKARTAGTTVEVPTGIDPAKLVPVKNAAATLVSAAGDLAGAIAALG